MSEIIIEKEKLLIECALSNRDIFIKVASILNEDYFGKPLDRVVKLILDFFQKYNNLPKISVIFAETGVQLEDRVLLPEEYQYVLDEIESHCQNEAMRMAILDSVDNYLPINDFGSIMNAVKQVMSISIDKDIGLDYFDDPLQRLLNMQQNLDACSIGWDCIDAVIDYIKRGDLFMVAGGTGGGKSVFLTNVMHNLVKAGKNCLYITFELRSDLVAKRADSIFTDICSKEIFERAEEVAERLNLIEGAGDFLIKKMPTATRAIDIRNYLMEYHLTYGFYPDAIAVDYLDLMAPNSMLGMKQGAFDKDKQITEELRDIMIDIDCYGFTASQLNRDAVGVEVIDHSHIAGGISKLNTVDVAVAITRTEEQIDNGELMVQAMKLRNAELTTKKIPMYMNTKTLLISEKKTQAPKQQAPAIPETADANNAKNRLNDLLRKNKRTP